MRIKSYIATILTLFLLSGTLLAYFIINEYKAIYDLTEEYNEYEFSLKDLQRAETIISSYLTLVDLVLGSGKTYLASKAMDNGRNAISTLGFRNINTLSESVENKVKETILSIEQINNILQRASTPLTPYKNAKEKQEAFNEHLYRADEISANLVSNFPHIIGYIYNITEENRKKLKQSEKKLNISISIILTVFCLFVVFIWMWISRKISLPLELLAQSAINAKDNEQYSVEVSHGPSEVIYLSKRINTLLGSLQHQATHDPLTGLFNRRVLNKQLNEVFNNWQENRQVAVLCYIDLDQFKLVNDTSGHAAGDQLLKNVANLLTSNVRKLDLAVRVGGDEFCLLFEGCDIDIAMQIANKIRDELENMHFVWGNQSFKISCSIGVAQIDESFDDVNAFVNAADTACSLAKDQGKNRVCRYDISDIQLAGKRKDVSCINQLNEALDSDGFELYKQGIFPTNPTRLSDQYYEILVRMKASDGQLLNPASFIPTAERYHLASRIDKWVIHNTIEWLSNNQYELDQLSLCSINLSGQSLCKSDVLEFIHQELSRSNVPAHKLCFEITETAVVSNIAEAKVFIEELRNLGCKFALDDFGSGLSSFGYLKELPVDILKIDGCFIKGLAYEHFDFAAVKSINEIAKSCGLKTVAAFVDSKEIIDKLKMIGVDFAQGYYLEEPNPLAPTELYWKEQVNS